MSMGSTRQSYHVFTFLRAIALLLGVLAWTPTAAQAYTCDICYADKVGSCKTFCANVPRGQLECEQHCLQRQCGKVCSTVDDSSSPGVAEEIAGCDSCVELMQRGPCLAECEKSQQRRRCISRCAKFKCDEKCKLPVGQQRPPQGPQMTCTECKDRAGSRCRNSCGDKNRPGFVACEVSCVEKRCFRACNPELF